MRLFIFLFLALLLGACSDNGSSVETPPPQEVSIKVAVILPLNESSSFHWHNTADWFEENLQKAFSRLAHGSSVKLDLEWIDEDSSNMKELSDALIKNEDIKAIIGPLKEDKLDTLAGYLAIANKHGPRKTLIAPKATDAEIVRKFGDEKWFFSLTETDITLNQMLLSTAIAMNAKSVSLLTSSANEENTFLDWFAFQAVELGLQINTVESYEDSQDVKKVAEDFFSTKQDFVICTPANYTEALEILRAHKKQKSTAKLLFSENAVDPEILKYPEAEGLVAISPGASPESGFDIAYFTKFDNYAISGSAQFYDALMLVAFAQARMLANNDSLFLDEHITELVRFNHEYNWAWEPLGMSSALEEIQKGQDIIDFCGASGQLIFDENNHSIVLETIYTQWIVKDKKFIPLSYKSTWGGSRKDQPETSYKYLYSHILPQIQGTDSARHIEYPPLKGNYALLIATTRTWEDYRHESGVYSMYSKLKEYGYDDDHIILIAEKNIITSDYNPAKGTWVNYNKEQIVDSLNADYKISELEPQDLFKILLGQKSERLPHVIQSDSTQNIFVYWSGHGERGSLGWKVGGTRSGSFSYDDMQTLVSTLSKEKKFRKMLWVVETCYSGSVCKAFDDVGAEGALCMTAANENETSKGLIYYAPFNKYLANSFSYNFMSMLDHTIISPQDNYDIPLSDMYDELYKATLGSHVSIYNSQNYGNLKLNEIGEFLVPVQ